MNAKIITLSNQSGGSGKTTLVFNIAHILADKGYKVIAVDLDPRANLTNYFNINRKSLLYSAKELLVKSTVFWKTTLFIKNNLYLIPSSDQLLGMDYHMIGKPFSYLQLSRKLEPAKKEYDFIIIDTPSYFNLFTVNAWNFSDLIISPFNSEPSSIDCLETLLKSTEGLPVLINVLLNKVKKNDKYKNLFINTFNNIRPENCNYIGEINNDEIVLESLFKKEPLNSLFKYKKTTSMIEDIANILVEIKQKI